MATTIKLRNSVVKDKAPAAADIQIGEVCVGAHSDSPALFFKDNADNIIKIEPGAQNVSELTNDASYITLAEVPLYTAEAGKGIAINASNEISINDDWSNIPVLS